MSKTVFKNSGELVHVWAHKRQAEGRTPTRRNSMFGGGEVTSAFFEGDYYYSYGKHYCIARHLPDGWVAINAEPSTSTTNMQVHEARWATKHLKQVFVSDPNKWPSKEDAERRARSLLEEAATKRSSDKKSALIARAVRIIEQHNIFCGLVGAPAEVAQQPEVSEEEIAKLKAHLLAAAKKARQAAKEREARILVEQAEAIELWRQSKVSNLHRFQGLPMMLRLAYRDRSAAEPEGYWMVETSYHAQIPVEDAKRLWPFILRAMAGERDYEVGMDLGGYRLTKIRRDGSIVVGCHDIPYKEIHMIAEKLGLVEAVCQAN